MSSCRELDNNRSALSAASAFAIATAGANEGTPTKEKYRRMSLASTGMHSHVLLYWDSCILSQPDLLAKFFSSNLIWYLWILQPLVQWEELKVKSH